MQDLLLLIFWMMTLKRRRVQCSMTRTQEHTIPKVHFFSLKNDIRKKYYRYLDKKISLGNSVCGSWQIPANSVAGVYYLPDGIEDTQHECQKCKDVELIALSGMVLTL